MVIEKYEAERDKYGRKNWWAKLKCDKCKLIFEECWKNTLKKQYKRSEHLCKCCLNQLMSQLSSERMKITRMRQTPEERKKIASLAGKKSQATGKPSETWFNRERWELMSDEDQRKQVTNANKALHNKLNSMSIEELADHYRKVMRGGIGYISKGQQELENSLKYLGFEGNQQIGSMNVDVCHHEKKIIVEFNGDAYHCNPKKWKKDQYNTLIKMTAGEKWNKDIARYAILRKEGYRVIIIWESNWMASKENCINLIEKIYETH